MIRKCISTANLAAGDSIDEIAAACAAAGFHSVVLSLSREGEFNLESERRAADRVVEQLAACKVRPEVLTSPLYADCNHGSCSASARQEADRITRALIERAAWIGAEVVVLTAARVGTCSDGFVSYDSALHHAFEGLLSAAAEAERFGVQLAVWVAKNHFLLSPAEARWFIDRLHSPVVRAAVDIGDLAAPEYSEDWLRTLSYRIGSVWIGCPVAARPDEDHVAPLALQVTPGVIAALTEIGYQGPLICQGHGELGAIAEALDLVCSRSVRD